MMEKRSLIIVIAITIVSVLTYHVLTTAEKYNPDERRAIEVGRYFLDGVGCKTGKVLFIKQVEKEPNFYWDIVLESDVEWDDLGVWDRMLKYDRPELREVRPCWVIRFEQAKRPGHYYEVWLDASEYIVVGGNECRGMISS
jgi:hypothetical protein